MGSAPSTPDRSALRRKSTGCLTAPASTRQLGDPTPPATDTMSPNPAAWRVRIALGVEAG